MPKFKKNVSLSRISNYKIGGPATYFFEATTEAELRWAIKEAKTKKLPIFVIGGATNLLIDDEGFKGVILRSAINSLKVKKNTTIEVGAGVPMSKLLNFAAARNFDGLAWAGGLPGTLGGAIRGNAGCFGGEIKEVVESVRSLDIKTGKIIERSLRTCRFGYRDSIYKDKNRLEIIISATLHLYKGTKKEITAVMKKNIEHRKKNHPLEYPNIGSIFKNVPLHHIHTLNSRKYKKALKDTSVTFHGSTFSVKTDPFPVISSAKLISESGLRGVSFGGAMISPKHPNFIVNVLGAGSSDVHNLITLAKAEVFRRFGVQLEEEIQTI